MKFMSVRELRGNAARVWRDLPNEKDMVVTNNGRPVAILSSVDGAHVEESLRALRRARAMAAVSALQQRSVQQGKDTLTATEIDAEIQAVRKIRVR
jgi:antitoxin (DNA-binding transcriptional repressor) of toxin-antitoxin stability system